VNTEPTTLTDNVTAEEFLDPPAVDAQMELLKAGITARVNHHLRATDCPQDMIQPFADAMTEFVERAIIKFSNGQKEHGGDFREINEDINLEQEVIDLVMYGPILRRLRRSYLKINLD
jgi:hypothetical protein